MNFYSFVRGIVSIPIKLFYNIKVEGMENVPKEGKLIICSNHTSILDPIILAIVYKRQIFFMAKKEMFKNKLFNYIFTKLGSFPVDRDGADLSAIKKALKVLKKDNSLGIFPEGTRVKSINLESAKPGVAMISLKGKAPIIPIYIDATYKLFSKVNIKIGKTIDFSDKYGEKLTVEKYQELSSFILKKIYNLKVD